MKCGVGNEAKTEPGMGSTVGNVFTKKTFREMFSADMRRFCYFCENKREV